jgi:importin subunit beta-1
MLRTGILEAFSGLIQGLGQAKADQYIRQLVPNIIAFVSSIGKEEVPDDVTAKSAVNLLGDVCSVFSTGVSVM